MSRALAMMAVAWVGALATARSQDHPAPARDVVEIVGQTSGFVELGPARTAADAIQALGGPARIAQQPVQDGDRIRVLSDGRVRIESGDALLFGQRLDLNRADVQGLMALPGVGASKSRAVQAARPYGAEADIVRARGLGRRAGRELAPLVHTRNAPETPVARPCNINEADATALARLSGVGPVLSERLVSDRLANGPFQDAAALERVHGIGPSLASRLDAQVVFE